MIAGKIAGEDTKGARGTEGVFPSDNRVLSSSQHPGKNRNQLAILVFLRWPEPGFVKTRLASAIGAEKACALYKEMAERSVQEVVKAFGRECAIVMHTGADGDCFARWLGGDLQYRLQREGDLGNKLQSGVAAAFEQGADLCLAVGGDCPGVTAGILRKAVSLLGSHDVVLGPAMDGGYYLIGHRAGVSGLYDSINWGSAEVFNQTMHRCQAGGCSVGLLELMRDVDTLEDAVALNLADPEGNLIALSGNRQSDLFI